MDEQAERSDSLQCPICLREVSDSEDAFLQPCYHGFCHSCLKRWISVEQQKDGTLFLCPVCRTSCIAYLHNCNLTAFDRTVLQPTLQNDANSTGPFVLSAEHRIRQAAYSRSSADLEGQSPGLELQQAHTIAEGPPLCTLKSALSGSAILQPQLRTLADPAVCLWIRRELQALLQLDDPGYVQLAVEQVLRRMLSTRGSAKRVSVSAPHAVQAAVRDAASPFIPEHAAQFSRYLSSFLTFRGTLSAWDQECLRQQVHRQRCPVHRRNHKGIAPGARPGTCSMPSGKP